MNKNLAGADHYHEQFSSEAYWETVETENRIDGSSIPTQPYLATSMPNPSLCGDQLCDIIDFTTNWTCVGSQNEEKRKNCKRDKKTTEITTQIFPRSWRSYTCFGDNRLSGFFLWQCLSLQ